MTGVYHCTQLLVEMRVTQTFLPRLASKCNPPGQPESPKIARILGKSFQCPAAKKSFMNANKNEVIQFPEF
jgi:hypothetical protein